MLFEAVFDFSLNITKPNSLSYRKTTNLFFLEQSSKIGYSFSRTYFDVKGDKMGKTTKSAGTKTKATVAYKVKKLTDRRIKMISEFLTKTIDSPDNVGDYFGSGAWMDMLIAFLREPKRCKSTKMDILAWLKDDCFKELIDRVNRSAAEKMGASSEIFQSGSMERAINLIKKEPEPSSSGEDMGLSVPVSAIKKEMAAVKEEVEDQWELYLWGPVAIKEETEMVLVKEELMLDDDELDEKLESGNQEMPMAGIGNDQYLDLSFKRSPVAFLEEMHQGGPEPVEVLEPEVALGDSAPDYYDPISPEAPPQSQSDEQEYQIPPPPHGHGHRANLTGDEDYSNEYFKKRTDALEAMVQDKLRRNDVTCDWNSASFALKIIQNSLSSLNAVKKIE